MTLKFPKRYNFTGKKFSGGMGNVFICEDKNLDRTVAIKNIKSSADTRRLLDEIAAFEKIRSKHVVEIFDIIKFGDSSYGIVQDYLPGEDLFAVAKKGGLSLEEYLKIIFQIASGLSDIHNIGCIHRDIKPNNIKFDQERLLKIFDFGLSRTYGKDSKTIGFTGTRGFSAPELYSTATVQFTEKIDVYSFGATAYFIANNSLPKKLLAAPPIIDSSKNYFSKFSISDVPGEICELLSSCLAKEAAARPDIHHVCDMISRYLLYGKHKAHLVSQGNSFVLDKVGKEIRVQREEIGTLKIKYDGLYFTITQADGEIFINNDSVLIGDKLPSSCVITIGNPVRKLDRTYVTFDVSYPEVVL